MAFLIGAAVVGGVIVVLGSLGFFIAFAALALARKV